MAVRKPDADLDGTTEAAAATVVVLGALAGTGWLALAAGTASVIVLALSEKARLHWLVRKFSEQELRATLQFAVLALVVLPLLPTGPFGEIIQFRPRALWVIVLFFSALNFAGFIARRAVGAGVGYTITGILGGLVSSTAVAFNFSRKSREDSALGRSLAFGVIGACTILVPRVVILSSILNPSVGWRVGLMLLLPAITGVLLLLLAGRRKGEGDEGATNDEDARNPLRLFAALQMAIVFQLALTLIALVHRFFGTVGLYATAGLLGMTDMDALTLSLSRTNADVVASVAARAIAIGILSNTIFKFGLTVGMGTGRFRRAAGGGLAAMAAASIIGLLLLSR
jgi:uncharacterized membrane protein (DUF4010 family)